MAFSRKNVLLIWLGRILSTASLSLRGTIDVTDSRLIQVVVHDVYGEEDDSEEGCLVKYDLAQYGADDCDSAWDVYHVNCTNLISEYGWDCTGCQCTGDPGGVERSSAGNAPPMFVPTPSPPTQAPWPTAAPTPSTLSTPTRPTSVPTPPPTRSAQVVRLEMDLEGIDPGIFAPGRDLARKELEHAAAAAVALSFVPGKLKARPHGARRVREPMEKDDDLVVTDVSVTLELGVASAPEAAQAVIEGQAVHLIAALVEVFREVHLDSDVEDLRTSTGLRSVEVGFRVANMRPGEVREKQDEVVAKVSVVATSAVAYLSAKVPTASGHFAGRAAAGRNAIAIMVDISMPGGTTKDEAPAEDVVNDYQKSMSKVSKSMERAIAQQGRTDGSLLKGLVVGRIDVAEPEMATPQPTPWPTPSPTLAEEQETDLGSTSTSSTPGPLLGGAGPQAPDAGSTSSSSTLGPLLGGAGPKEHDAASSTTTGSATEDQDKACHDSAGAATGVHGHGCEYWSINPDRCDDVDAMDDSDFTAWDMCCACNGSHGKVEGPPKSSATQAPTNDPTQSPTQSPTPSPTDIPTGDPTPLPTLSPTQALGVPPWPGAPPGMPRPSPFEAPPMPTPAPAACEYGIRFTPDMRAHPRTHEPDWLSCQRRCASVRGCAHFSYWPDGGCYVHDSSAVREEMVDAISGSPYCSVGLSSTSGQASTPSATPTAAPTSTQNFVMVRDDGKCKGRGDVVKASSVEECAHSCATREGCQFLSYSSQAGECRLTETCDDLGIWGAHGFSIYRLGADVPTPAPVPYTKVRRVGRCRSEGPTIPAKSVEFCATACEHQYGCKFFSFSGSQCKLTEDCEKVGLFPYDYSVYQLGDPGSVPTPAPVSYERVHQSGKCNSFGPTIAVSSVDECASACSQSRRDCHFFTISSTKCKLTADCDEVQWQMAGFDIYQLGPGASATAAEEPSRPQAQGKAPDVKPGAPSAAMEDASRPLAAAAYHHFSVGRCRGDPLEKRLGLRSGSHIEDCAAACRATQACSFFSFSEKPCRGWFCRAGKCKLSASCDDTTIGQGQTAFNVYQMDPGAPPQGGPQAVPQAAPKAPAIAGAE